MPKLESCVKFRLSRQAKAVRLVPVYETTPARQIVGIWIAQVRKGLDALACRPMKDGKIQSFADAIDEESKKPIHYDE